MKNNIGRYVMGGGDSTDKYIKFRNNILKIKFFIKHLFERPNSLQEQGPAELILS